MISGSQFNLPQSSGTVGRQLGNQMQTAQTQLTSLGNGVTSGGIGGRPPNVNGAASGPSGSTAFRNPSA